MPARILPAFLIFCIACGDGADRAEEADAVMTLQAAPDYGTPAPAPPPPPAGVGNALELESLAAAQSSASQIALADSLRPPMLIRNGHVQIEVETLDTAIASVRGLATGVGGHVANVTMQLGERQVRQAMITLRIPASRFDEVMGGLEPLGELEVVEVGTEDVGEEYMDLERRLANARRLEERLLELLATRTGELEDVLAVERELARVREQVERFEGRLRYLRTRVAMSTLVVTVHEPEPLLARPGDNMLLRSVRQAGRNFLELVGIAIASLGFVVPLLLVGWGVLVLWRWRRRRLLRGEAD